MGDWVPCAAMHSGHVGHGAAASEHASGPAAVECSNGVAAVMDNAARGERALAHAREGHKEACMYASERARVAAETQAER